MKFQRTVTLIAGASILLTACSTPQIEENLQPEPVETLTEQENQGETEPSAETEEAKTEPHARPLRTTFEPELILHCETENLTPEPEKGWENTPPNIEDRTLERDTRNKAALEEINSIDALYVIGGYREDGEEILLVRIDLAPERNPEQDPRIFLDLDGDRNRGMWTYQASVSSSAWNLMIENQETIWRSSTEPDQWGWEETEKPESYRYIREGNSIFLCIPQDLVDQNTEQSRHIYSIGVTVEKNDSYLPSMFLGGISAEQGIPNMPLTHPANSSALQESRTPLNLSRLSFSYSFAPWTSRGCPEQPEDMTCAQEAYEGIEHVVFGGGIEEPTHSSHENTKKLIEALYETDPEREIWGYISLRRHSGDWHNYTEVLRRAKLWQNMNVTGIFIDEFDMCKETWQTCPRDSAGNIQIYSRDDQRKAVEGIHALNLAVFVNAHSIHSALGIIDGTEIGLGGAENGRHADMYLLENPNVSSGMWREGLNHKAAVSRAWEANAYKEATGIRIAVVDTLDKNVKDQQENNPKYQASWWMSALGGAETHSFSNPIFSASGDVTENLAKPEPPLEAQKLHEKGLELQGEVYIENNGTLLWRELADQNGEKKGRVEIRIDTNYSMKVDIKLY